VRDSGSRGASTPRIAPTARLSSRGLVLLLLGVCLAPLTGLTFYAVRWGRAAEKQLPVLVQFDQRYVPTVNNGPAVLTDVVVIINDSDFEIPQLTININGQYFLYQDQPLKVSEKRAVPLQIFATKANQRWVLGRYPIESVTVTGRLPSGARGVTESLFEKGSDPFRRGKTTN
jgi:hypothetical protein